MGAPDGAGKLGAGQVVVKLRGLSVLWYTSKSIPMVRALHTPHSKVSSNAHSSNVVRSVLSAMM